MHKISRNFSRNLKNPFDKLKKNIKFQGKDVGYFSLTDLKDSRIGRI
jgi:hypothetical protein